MVKIHPLYKKRYTRHKKYYVHDEDETANIGDMVKIRADRPRSRLKRWLLVDVITKAAV
jgi:small subunit ribosomal protein S17